MDFQLTEPHPILMMYSEQNKPLHKGQISLVTQIAAQRTKTNSWKICLTKVDTLPFITPNHRSLVLANEWFNINFTIWHTQWNGFVLNLRAPNPGP